MFSKDEVAKNVEKKAKNVEKNFTGTLVLLIIITQAELKIINLVFCALALMDSEGGKGSDCS